MNTIEQNLRLIQQQIKTFATGCGRNPQDIRLLAVSKTKPLADIESAYRAGQVDFGENYLQEAMEKISQLQHLPLQWHYIGAIQSNKTRPIAEHFDWIHTLSSLKHAQRLNDQRPAELPALNCCIQVNISHEQSKSGITEKELAELAKQISAMPHLKLRGLMAIPAPTTDLQQQKIAFRRLRQLMDELNTGGFQLDTLSMGMSDDMQAAIEEGSTMLRIGTAIFGKRL
jgi:pyridoxal phosphate enzyme (YggS family)